MGEFFERTQTERTIPKLTADGFLVDPSDVSRIRLFVADEALRNAFRSWEIYLELFNQRTFSGVFLIFESHQAIEASL